MHCSGYSLVVKVWFVLLSPLIVKGSFGLIHIPIKNFISLKGFNPLPFNDTFKEKYKFSGFLSKGQLKTENLDYEIAKQNLKIGSILPIEWVWIKNPWMKIEK